MMFLKDFTRCFQGIWSTLNYIDDPLEDVEQDVVNSAPTVNFGFFDLEELVCWTFGTMFC